MKDLRFEGKSFDDALDQASQALKIPQDSISYEVKDEKRSMFGLGQVKWVVIAVKVSEDQENHHPKDEPSQDSSEEALPPSEPIPSRSNFKITVLKEGVFLRVYPAEGSTDRIGLKEDIDAALGKRLIRNVDQKIISQALEQVSGEPVRIADWKEVPGWDSTVGVDVSSEFIARIIIRSPRYGGRIPEYDEILSLIERQNVVYGIDPDKIKEMLEEEIFDKSVIVARGKAAVNGEDETIEFLFKTNNAYRAAFVADSDHDDDQDSTVSFRDSGSIESVVEGVTLAKIHPPTQGVLGYNVYGDELGAEDGSRIDIKIGEGALLSDDRSEIVATANGNPRLIGVHRAVSVARVYEVESVDYGTGNIVFLGSVIVRGDVQDGFDVSATGDIEIRGTVGRSQIVSEGNIFIRQGVNGGGQGLIKAGKGIYTRYIENVRVEAGEDVIVQEEIIHADLRAGARVIVNGRKAKIIGGRIRAGQDIYSKDLGSDAFTDTTVESGTDFQAQDSLEEFIKMSGLLEENLGKLSMSITRLKKQKAENDEGLSEAKERLLTRCERSYKEGMDRLGVYQRDISSLNSYLSQLESNGKISAKNLVYPGVVVILHHAKYVVRDYCQNVSFVYEEGKGVTLKVFRELRQNAARADSGPRKQEQKA